METKLVEHKLSLVCSSKGYEEIACVIQKENEPIANLTISPYGGSLVLLTKDSEVKVGTFKERYTGKPIEVELEW